MRELNQHPQKSFCLVLIKPSHYDDDGYVIQWLRAPVPSNSLAVIYGLALDCARRKVLGDDVEIDIHPLDETHTRIRPKRIAALIEKAGAGMVMLVGVQSNQFPRALDIAVLSRSISRVPQKPYLFAFTPKRGIDICDRAAHFTTKLCPYFP